MENDLKIFHSTLSEDEEGISVILRLVDGFSTWQVNISTKSSFLSLIIGRTKIFLQVSKPLQKSALYNSYALNDPFWKSFIFFSCFESSKKKI